MNKIPRSLQGVLWSKGVRDLNLDADKTYIIHQVLRYGSIEDIRWLLRTYDSETIRKTFLNHPAQVYSKSSLHFVKNAVLDLEQQRINERAYLQSLY